MFESAQICEISKKANSKKLGYFQKFTNPPKRKFSVRKMEHVGGGDEVWQSYRSLRATVH